jgi:16S rRNA (guanine(527)-N(7))-methyltransferase RsmG
MIEILQHNVSRHELDLINQYISMIFHWNKKINITSRHITKQRIYDFICEGIAITKLLDANKSISIADVGSGAGFPGIILGILGYKNCNLIEINTKKAAFLQYVNAELNLGIKIHNKDVRSINLENLDYIVSKAVTSAENLMELCVKIRNANTKTILCKSSETDNFDLKIVTLHSKNASRDYKLITC